MIHIYCKIILKLLNNDKPKIELLKLCTGLYTLKPGGHKDFFYECLQPNIYNSIITWPKQPKQKYIFRILECYFRFKRKTASRRGLFGFFTSRCSQKISFAD